MGLVAGSAQAAQGMSMLAFPFVFVSSAYVPVESMPGWLQPVAEHQPITPMVGAVRALALGDEAEAALGHSAGWFAVRALAWSVADRGRLPAAGHPPVRPALTCSTRHLTEVVLQHRRVTSVGSRPGDVVTSGRRRRGRARS